MRKPREYKALETALKANLEARGLVEPIYLDMVKTYLDLYVLRGQLMKDINQRGVCVEDEKAGRTVENRSVSLMAQISSRMLQIYTSLGYKDAAAASPIAIDADDDEL